MGYPVQINNTTIPLEFGLVQSSDHVSPLIGASPVVQLSKNGAAFAPALGAITEVGNGTYSLAPNAIDANTFGTLKLHATAAGADPQDDVFRVVSYNPESGGLPKLDSAGNSKSDEAKWNGQPIQNLPANTFKLNVTPAGKVFISNWH